MEKCQFEDEYQVSIKYSCNYEIPEETKDRYTIAIECRFQEEFPISRPYIEEIHNYVERGIDGQLITENAWVVPKDEEGNYDLNVVAFKWKESSYKDRPGYVEIYPIVLGFSTYVCIDKSKGASNEKIHETIKKRTKDIASIILHSPLIKTEAHVIKGEHIITDTKPNNYFFDWNHLNTDCI